MELTRRAFVGTAGAAAVAVGAASQFSVPAHAEEVAVPPAPTAAGYGLNPQDTDWRGNTMPLTKLFEPWSYGNIPLNHRMMKSAAGSATYLAGLTDELFDYYLNFAKGGVEMIYVEMVNELGPMSNEITPETQEFAERLVAACAEYGAVLGYQNYAFAPKSAQEMTPEEISDFQDQIAGVAKIIKGYGFKAFEINAAGFNLGESFLTRAQNIREDEYGYATFENRARYVCELIKKIKAECGEDFHVQVLMNIIEENDSGYCDDSKVTPYQEGIEFAKLFEAAGADSLHLRLGPLTYHPCQFAGDLYFLLNGFEGQTTFGYQWDFSKHWQGMIDGRHSGAGMTLDIAAEYKKAVNIPCGVVTYMDPAHAPDFFETALEEGKADFFLMTRPLTVDFDYVNKLREGRIDEIAPCTRCLHCHIGGNGDNRARGYCRVNALTQRVMTENGPATYELPPAETAKKVMVVGGGPAGMEAARIAAYRGHDVTLYEKSGMLGGLLPFASYVKGPHENLDDLNAYLQRQLEVAGVKVVTETKVDADFINAQAPDALVLATGAGRVDLGLSGEAIPVVELDDFVSGEFGNNVVVYGSNAEATDCALWLLGKGKNVTIVTSDPMSAFDKQQSEHAQEYIKPALFTRGVRVWPGASITGVAEGVLTIASETGASIDIPCDTILDAACLVADTSILESVSVAETYAIGDCVEPFNIALAIRAGNDAGRAI